MVTFLLVRNQDIQTSLYSYQQLVRLEIPNTTLVFSIKENVTCIGLQNCMFFFEAYCFGWGDVYTSKYRGYTIRPVQ